MRQEEEPQPGHSNNEVETERANLNNATHALRVEIVTVVSSPSTGFEFTRNSVQELWAQCPGTRWLVVVGQRDSNINKHLSEAQCVMGDALRVVQESRPGIYQAMNQALALIQCPRFVFLNCGDFLVPNAGELLVHCSDDRVTSFRGSWHDSHGRQVETPRRRNAHHPRLGLLANHQAMVFPASFTRFAYDESLPVAADQDLKHRLVDEDLIERRDEFLVSSMTGGVSTGRQSLNSAIHRYAEYRRIFRRYYGRVWTEIISFSYLLRLLLRQGDN